MGCTKVQGMKTCPGILAVFVMILAGVTTEYACLQPLQMKTGGHVVLRRKFCNQTIDQANLQEKPEICYNDILPADYRYTLLLLEKNQDHKTYTIHWFITNITVTNSSLTENKTTIMDYVPPNNKNTTEYKIMVCSHDADFRPPVPSHHESTTFIPEMWYNSIKSTATLVHDGNFIVLGRNTSSSVTPFSTDSLPTFHPSPSIPSSIHTHTPSTLSPSPPVTQTPPTTHPPRSYPSTEIITKSPYHIYNTANNSSIAPQSSQPTHKRSLANNNVFGIAVIIIPIISVALNTPF